MSDVAEASLTWTYGIVRTNDARYSSRDIYVAAIVWISGDQPVMWEAPGLFSATSAAEIRKMAANILADIQRNVLVFDGNEIPSESWT